MSVDESWSATTRELGDRQQEHVTTKIFRMPDVAPETVEKVHVPCDLGNNVLINTVEHAKMESAGALAELPGDGDDALDNDEDDDAPTSINEALAEWVRVMCRKPSVSFSQADWSAWMAERVSKLASIIRSSSPAEVAIDLEAAAMAFSLAAEQEGDVIDA